MALNHPTDDSLYLDDAGMTYSAGAGTMVGAFSPSNKSASVTLADSNKTAELPSGGAYHMARGPVAITGEAYIEFTINQLPATTGGKIGVGLINSVLTNYDAALTTSNTAGFFAPNNAGGGGGYAHATGYGINGGGYASVLSGQEWVVGTVIGMAISMSAKTVKITLDGTTYSSAMDITALGTTIYPAVGLYNTDDSITLNAGDTPFEYVPPAGYSGPDVGGTMTTAYGHVDGSPYIFEFGTDPWRGFAAFEPSVLDLSSGDEVYNLIIEGNTASDFSGTSHDLASWNLRALNPQDVIVVDNGYADIIYPYGRLKLVFSGTTPSIRLTAFLKPLADAPTYTLAEQLTVNVETLSALSKVNKYIRDWSAGPFGGGPNHDGTYPMVDGIGNVIYVKSPQQIIADATDHSPFQFGAIGDGSSHPASDVYATLADCQAVYDFATSLDQEIDFLAWQAALYAGGRIVVQPASFKMCNNVAASQGPLIAISGTFEAFLAGGKLDFSDMAEQTDDTEFVENSDFATNTDWENASIYDPSDIIMTTFGSGKALMTDTGTGDLTQLTFYQWGQLVNLVPGKYTVKCVVSATRGDSYDLGNVNPPYAGISFSSDSPGEGSDPIGRSAFTRFDVFLPGDAPDVKTLKFDFQLTTSGSAYLTFTGGGYANFEVTSFTIKKWLPNCAILATRDGSPDHYPIPRGFDGLELIGPGYDSGITGVKYKSFSNIDGNLIRFSNSLLHDFDRIFSFGDGAYLTQFDNVHAIQSGTAIFTELGTTNAGENLRWYGGGIYNNVVGIDGQGGMEVTLYGTAFDYCGQMVINGGGRYEFHGVHCETHLPSVSNPLPTFHLTDGYIGFHGGMFLGVDAPNTAPVCPIDTVTSGAVFEVFGTEVYNLSSDPAGTGKGAAMSGPGQFKMNSWRNLGNPNIGPYLLSYAPVMDGFGGNGLFPDPSGFSSETSGVLLEGGAYPDALPEVTFTGSASGSTLTITSITDLVYEGQLLKGPNVKPDTVISFIPTTGGTGGAGTYRISRPQTIPSQTLKAQYDGIYDKWNNVNGTVEWSGAYSVDGSNCLKFTKHNDGLNSALRFLLPVRGGQNTLGYVKFLFPNDYSPTDPDDTAPLYYRLFWIRSLGHDRYGRPIITKNTFVGETDIYVPLAGSPDWVTRFLSSTYANQSQDPDNELSSHSPSWATHLGIFLDTQSLPDGLAFYMAAMRSNVFG